MQRETIDILTLHRFDDARVFGRQARSLVSAGYRVRLITPKGESGLRDGVEIIGVKPGRNRFETFSMVPGRILAAHLHDPARFAYIHDAPLMILAPILSAMGVEVLYDVHEDYENMLRHRDWIPGPLRNIAGTTAGVYERLMARHASGIAAATAPLLDKFEWLAPDRRIALYNLPTMDMVAAGHRQTTPTSRRRFDIVHLGSLSDSRMTFFADMLTALQVLRPGAKARIIGLLPHQGPWLRERFGEEVLEIIERLPHDQVAGALGQCRIGLDIHPWLLPHLALAVPVKAFEYMACGCALVTSHLPEFEALLASPERDRVAVVNGDDPKRYAGVVADLLADPVGLDARSMALQNAMSAYTWDRERERLLRWIDDLALQPRPVRSIAGNLLGRAMDRLVPGDGGGKQ